jgi:hypothetical protein
MRMPFNVLSSSDQFGQEGLKHLAVHWFCAARIDHVFNSWPVF